MNTRVVIEDLDYSIVSVTNIELSIYTPLLNEHSSWSNITHWRVKSRELAWCQAQLWVQRKWAIRG